MNGVLAMVLAIISTVGGAGQLFTGPTSSSAGSGFLLGTSALVTYSQMPHVVEDFRQKKAVREFGLTMEAAKALSADELLDLIRDDEPAVIRANGGNFINGNMNG